MACEDGGWAIRCGGCGLLSSEEPSVKFRDHAKQILCNDCEVRGSWQKIIGSMPDLPDPEKAEDGYESLRHVLDLAVEQAKSGKGKERHASEGQAFVDQPIVTEGEAMGSNHFQLGQARKKLLESIRLPPDRARAEILGAINYAAAAYLLIK